MNALPTWLKLLILASFVYNLGMAVGTFITEKVPTEWDVVASLYFSVAIWIFAWWLAARQALSLRRALRQYAHITRPYLPNEMKEIVDAFERKQQ